LKISSVLHCKNLLRMSFIVMFLLSATMVNMINVIDASPATYVWVDPPEVRGVMPTPPSNKFLIKIRVKDAPFTYAWAIFLKWNPALFYVNYTKEGDFLKNKGSTAFAYTPWDEANLTGEMSVTCSLIGSLPQEQWASGDGLLVSLGFFVTSTGSSVLNLYKTSLYDHIEEGYPASTYYPNKDGFFSNVAVHDVAVTNVTTSLTEVIPGNSVSIDVTVKNEGNFTETFDLAVYADVTVYNMTVDWWPDEVVVGDEITVGTQTGITLDVGVTTILSFTWNTTGVAEGSYTISAKSLLPDDDTRDNTFINGKVNLKPLGAPSASFTYSPEHPVVDEAITFNASLSSAQLGKNITSYLWDFETDGSIDINTTDPITHHAYSAYGTYTVTLTVKDNEGITDSLIKSIFIAKMSSAISITASPASVVVGASTTISGAISPVRTQVTVTIHSRPSGGAWTALTTVTTDSNGQYSYILTPTTFATYELKASWPGDAKTLQSESSIIPLVVKAPPIASFTYTPTSPDVDETVTFTSTSTDADGTITAWNWDFGDGAVASGQVVAHKYAIAGDFTVKLTVTDNDGLTHTESKQITIVKANSTITVYMYPPTITLGESVTINGTISPTRQDANVTIQCRLSGETEWNTLWVLQTVSTGSYEYSWTPKTTGTYEIRAKWQGDEKTLSAQSETKTVTVNEVPVQALNILLYVAAGIATIVIIGIVIYILKFRKPP